MRKIRFWGFKYNQAVVKGAEHLGISEYELFAMAYRGWFKQDPDPQELKQSLAAFQTQGSLPHWLKHYLRQLNARTRYMSEPRTKRPALFCGWLSRYLVLMLLPNSTNFFKQLSIQEKYSLYC